MKKFSFIVRVACGKETPALLCYWDLKTKTPTPLAGGAGVDPEVDWFESHRESKEFSLPRQSHTTLTTAEAAALAGVSRQAVGQWIAAGLLVSERRGKMWFVHSNSLSDFLRARGEVPSQLEGITMNVRYKRDRTKAAA